VQLNITYFKGDTQYLNRVFGRSSGSFLNIEVGGNSNYHFCASVEESTC